MNSSTTDSSYLTVTQRKVVHSQAVVDPVLDLGRLTATPVFVLLPPYECPRPIIRLPDYGASARPATSKDALMEDPGSLRRLYAEFAEEDRRLAQIGLAHYARMLRQEESLA